MQPRLTQDHCPPYTNPGTLTRHHSILFGGSPAHQHQQTGVRSPPSTSCLSSWHLLSLRFFKPHLHLCATSSFVLPRLFCLYCSRAAILNILGHEANTNGFVYHSYVMPCCPLNPSGHRTLDYSLVTSPDISGYSDMAYLIQIAKQVSRPD